MKLSKLFGDAELPYPPELGELEITKIVTDSRQATEGCLFLCMRGLHTDSHGYAENAISAGARVIVAEYVREACVGGAAAYIVLENTRKAAALLYNAWYGQPTKKMKIVGVTGTNGKTSVSSLLYAIFTRAGYRCGLLGTVCRRTAGGRLLPPQAEGTYSDFTTPDPELLYGALAQMAEDGVEFVFMEVSSHALALHKVDAISFDMALFTNLTQDHLDFHGDMGAYFDAKQRLFTMCRQAVVCIDSEAGKRIASACACPVRVCSEEEGDYCAKEICAGGLDGSDYLARTPQGDFALSVPIAGSFSVMNSLMAAAVALEYGIERETVRLSLAECVGVDGRMERVDCAPCREISALIDYAHTPDALEKLLKSVRALRRAEQRLVLIFGCGGERDRGKRKEMGRIASRLADFVIVTSDNSRGEPPEQIFSDILRGMDRERPYTLIADRREAIEYAVRNARAGDILVLAGKGHERYEINARGRFPFDERDILKDALRERDGTMKQR